MKRLSVALMLVVASSVFAQEIGTEITPVTPDSSANKPKQEPPPPDTSSNQNTSPSDSNPWGSKSSSSSSSSKKKDEAKKAAAPEAPREGLVSAGAGSFGIRATFGTGDLVPSAPTGNTAPAIGSVGVSYWATDGFTLLFDAGFGMAVSPTFALGFSAIVGMDYHFGSVGDALRPLVNVQAGVVTGLAGDPVSAMALTAQVAGGAEYFFSPQFSVTGRLGFGFRLGFATSSVSFALLTPSIGAAWYF